MPTTGRDIVSDALLELNVIQAGDVMEPDAASFGIGKLARIFDNWNADRGAVYADQFNTYVLTPGLSPHTIGPTGTWVIAQRPESIEAASLVFNTTNNPSIPIDIKDAAWYASLSVPTISLAVFTGLYYEKAWPNGKVFFNGKPSTAYSIQLLTRITLTALSLTDPFTMPPGYQDAATLTLAEELAGPFEKSITRDLERRAREARARVFGNNTVIPPLVTRDSGMPSAGRATKGTYLVGWW